MGKNEDLLIQLELYNHAGLCCEALVDKIKQKLLSNDVDNVAEEESSDESEESSESSSEEDSEDSEDLDC